MKKLILFITALLGLVGCNSYQNPHVNTVSVVENTSNFTSSITSSSESISSSVETSDEPEILIKEYKTDALRIMSDTTKAVWGEEIPENPYTEPDEDGVIYTNYVVDWGEATNTNLGTSLLEFQRLKDFPEYLSILQPPITYQLEDNSEVVAMFMVTSNCLHVLCVYDYYENGRVNIKFEAGPYKAFI